MPWVGATRCTQCGDLRRSLFTRATAATTCGVCGGELATERRLPGRDRRRETADETPERREELDRRDAPVSPG